MTIPIRALTAVPLPFSAASSLPAEIMYWKPPMIRNNTATPKAMASSQLITVLISWLMSVPALQLRPVAVSQGRFLFNCASATNNGANTNNETKSTCAITIQSIFFNMCFNSMSPPLHRLVSLSLFFLKRRGNRDKSNYCYYYTTLSIFSKIWSS